MSNPEFVVEQSAEPAEPVEQVQTQEPDRIEQNEQKKVDDEKKKQQLFLLGRKIAAAFNIRALKAWPTKSGNKVFVLTGSHFLLIELKNTTTVSLFKWSSLQSFTIPEKGGEIKMSFKQETKLAEAEGYTVKTDKLEFTLTFKEQFDDIASEVIDIIHRVLTDSELDKIGFSQLKPPYIADTSKSALCRLKMGSQGKPPRFSQKTLQHMTKIIQVGTQHVDLSEFDDIAKFLPTFLDCVPFIHTLKSIEIPQITKIAVGPLIAKLLKQRSSLKAITINGRYKSKDLNYVVDAIKTNTGLKLRGIEFGLSSFESKELNIISDLLSHSNINTIGFHDAFQSPQELNCFYNTVLNPSITQNLYCLNLNKTYNLDIEKLFPKLSKIRFLSLAYCDLEIIDVISKLPLIAMPRLTEIDLSGNRVSFEKYLDENTKLPQYLSSLILNNMSWPSDSFTLFMYQIFKHIQENLKLSLSNTIMDENEWYKFFASLENENRDFSGLSVLVWDYNPLHKNFFSFLKRNKRLTRLQMNYCFRNDADETDVFDKLNNYLSSAKNLKTLIIRGNEENNFGNNTPRLIEVINSIPNLEQLDISESYGGNQSLKSIEDLCNKNKTMKINFDGLYPNNFLEYSEYYTRFVSIRPPPAADNSDINTNPTLVNQPSLLRISFPFNDMTYLVNKGIAKERDVRHFEDLFFYSPDEEKARVLRAEKKNSNKNKLIRFKPIRDSEIAQPGNLYQLNADQDFPHYIDEEVVQQFKNDVQTLSLNGKPEYEDDNIDDAAFRSMLLNSRRFSFRQNNTDSPSPLSSPIPLRERQIRRPENDKTSSGTNDSEEESNTQNESHSEEEEEADSERAPQTPKGANVNQKVKEQLSENESSVSLKDIGERDIPDVSVQTDSEENDDSENPSFKIPQLVDVKKYNYSGWKNLDKEFTLQNMYSKLTQTKRSSELASIKSRKGKK